MTLSASKAQLWDYTILAARVLLAGTFLTYGCAKLAHWQFGITAAEAAKPVGELGLFRLSWYLFGQEPFKSFVGVAQVLAALLLLWNRTALLGALLLLPIAANVLVVDITYLKMPSLYGRLSYYIGLIFLILWHYRDRMRIVWDALTRSLTTRFHYPWWAYAMLPIAAIGLDVVEALPQVLYYLSIHPGETWRSMAAMIKLIWTHLTS
jgi:uncharacterized membrane protein YphA (DoxX/SURF4 family)